MPIPSTIVAATRHPGAATVLGSWQFDPLVVSGMLLSAVLYLRAVLRVWRTHSPSAFPRLRVISFLAGLAVLYLALQSPIDTYADQLLSDHMGQHLLLTMVAAPLLVLGTPVTLALAATSARSRRRFLLPVLHSRIIRVACCTCSWRCRSWPSSAWPSTARTGSSTSSTGRRADRSVSHRSPISTWPGPSCGRAGCWSWWWPWPSYSWTGCAGTNARRSGSTRGLRVPREPEPSVSGSGGKPRRERPSDLPCSRGGAPPDPGHARVDPGGAGLRPAGRLHLPRGLRPQRGRVPGGHDRHRRLLRAAGPGGSPRPELHHAETRGNGSRLARRPLRASRGLELLGLLVPSVPRGGSIPDDGMEHVSGGRGAVPGRGSPGLPDCRPVLHATHGEPLSERLRPRRRARRQIRAARHPHDVGDPGRWTDRLPDHGQSRRHESELGPEAAPRLRLTDPPRGGVLRIGSSALIWLLGRVQWPPIFDRFHLRCRRTDLSERGTR